MIKNENIFKKLQNPHISEKSSTINKKNKTITFKINKKANKLEIKNAIQKIFKVKIKNINTLIIKGKTKIHGKNHGKRKNWKKAYISLKNGQNIDIISEAE